MNRYNFIFNEIEEKYKGKEKEILNKAQMECLALEDKILPDKVNNYKMEVIEKAVKDINDLEEQYLKDLAMRFDGIQQRLNTPPKDTRTNTEKLLDEIAKSNKLKLLELKYSSMPIENILANVNTMDELEVLVAKATATQKDVESKYNLDIQNMKYQSPQNDLDQCLTSFKTMVSNKGNLGVGMEIGEKLALDGNTREYMIKSAGIDTKEVRWLE